MTMTDWARHEVELACKKENPKWDGKSFDYGCSCYMSALKAYESIMQDEHSGYSYSITKNILKRLLDEKPLTPITDEDFFSVERGTEEWPAESEEYLKDVGLKSSLQCPRKTSLFRKETPDGKVTYHDVDRAYCVNVEFPDDIFGCWLENIVDEVAPITMPYFGEDGRWKVYVRTFLCDEKNGDFDHHGVPYIESPKGERITIDRYYREGENGEWEQISRDQFDQDDALKRIDTVEKKVCDNLFYVISSLCEDQGSQLTKEQSQSLREGLESRCGVYNHLDPKYRTLREMRKMVRGEKTGDQVVDQALQDLMNYTKPWVVE